MFVYHKGGGTPSGPTSVGWNLLKSILGTSGSLHIYWVFAPSTGTQSSVLVSGLTSSSVGSMASFSGVDPDSPFQREGDSNTRVKSRANGSESVDGTDTTTKFFFPDSGGMIVGFTGYDNDASTDWSGGSLAYKSAALDLTTFMTEIADALTTGGTDTGGSWAYHSAIGDTIRGISPTHTEGGAGTATNVAALLVLRADITPADVSTISDNFNDNSLDGTTFYNTTTASASVAEQNQRLELSTSAASANQAGVLTIDRYAVDDVTVKVPISPTVGTHQMFGFTDGDVFIGASEAAGIYFDWDTANDLLYARYADEGSTSSASVTYTSSDRSANPYWRFLNDGTNLKWQIGDGSSWTDIRSVSIAGFLSYTLRGFDLDNLRLYFGIDSSVAGTVYFDDLDVLGPGSQNVAPSGIASAGAFGTAVITTGPVDVAPSGIASTEAFGTAKLTLKLLPTGIATAEAFGTPILAVGAAHITPGGIASAEVFGTAVVSPGPVTVQPSGIASTEAFGSVTVAVGAVDLQPSSIASAEAFGTASLTTGPVDVSPSGIASTEAFGTAVVGNAGIPSQDLDPSGIGSAEAFGSATLTTGPVDVAPAGIGSAETFGNPLVSAGGILVAPPGIASTEAFGSATVAPGPVTVSPTGIPAPSIAINEIESLNHDFASGVGDWTPFSIGGVGSLTQDAGPTAGTFAAKYTNDSDNGGLFIEPVGTYSITTGVKTIRFMAKATGFHGIWFEATLDGGAVFAQTDIVSLTSDWAEYTVSADFGSGTDLDNFTVRFTQFPDANPSAGWITDIRIEDADLATLDAFGSPTVTGSGATVAPSGVVSSEAFGAAVILTGPVDVAPSGVASLEAFGTPAVEPGPVDISCTGIASAEAFGTAVLAQTPEHQFILPTGITMPTEMGVPTLTVDQELVTVGIPTAEVFGGPITVTSVRYFASTPTIDQLPVAYRDSMGRADKLHQRVSFPVGLTVYVIDGEYHVTRNVPDSLVADVIYHGGRKYEVSASLAEELEAQGFTIRTEIR